MKIALSRSFIFKRDGCKCSMRYIVTCAVVCSIATTTAFNVDTKYPTLIKDPSNQAAESYFGYTLQFLFDRADKKQNFNDWLLVGAPKANSTYPQHSTLNEPGVLYSCSINRETLTVDKCSQIVVQSSKSASSSVEGSSFVGERNYGWLGGSLSVNNASNGRIAVCAHRWTNKQEDVVNGACYWSEHDINIKEDFHAIRPLIKNDRQVTSDNKVDYGKGQAGFSVHMAQINGREEIIMGAPGVYDWTGSVIRVSDNYRNSSIPNPSRRRKRQIVVPLGKTTVAEVSELNELQPYDYFGYSVYSGYFLSVDKLSYVAGAPRGAGLKGKVLLFDFHEENLRIQRELTGVQLGEYYGASLVATSLNMDKLDELLVGAPQYSLNSGASAMSGDEGKVYVYFNSGGKLIEAQPLYGNKVKGARFGSTIALLGDINRDNFNDVAVGAPYENDRGAVYIYLGGKGGIEYGPVSEYWQRIAPSDFTSIPASLKGFGISISAGDIDRNGYLDLAIGSFLSGHAVVLRSRPIIQFSYTMTIIGDGDWKIAPDAQVLVKACFTFTSQYQTAGSIRALDARYQFFVDAEYLNNPRLSLEVDSQTISQQPYNFTENLLVDRPKCRQFTIRVLKSTQQDFSKPAKLRISANLLESNTKSGFCTKCPVRDEKLGTFYEQRLSFTSECGVDEICEEDLEVNAYFPNLETFVIGSEKVIEFQVSVKNYAEPSYVTRIDLFLPPDTSLDLSRSGHCTARLFGEQVYSCNLYINPLRNSSTMDPMKIYLDVSNLSSRLDNLKIGVEARVGSGQARGRQPIFNLTLPLTTEIDLEILGSPPLEQRTYQVVNGSRNATRDRLPLEHGFEIRNVRPSIADAVDIEILVPISFTVNGRLVPAFDPNITVQASQRGRPGPVPCTVSEVLELNDRKLKATAEIIKYSLSYPSEAISQIARRATVIDCLNSPDVRCRIVSCTARSLAKDAEFSVFVSGTVLLQHILDHVADHVDFVFSSVARISLRRPDGQNPNHRPDMAIASTHILPQGPPAQEAVAGWIIALAVLAGAALLALSAYGLYKVGFFKRQRIPQDELLQNVDDGAAAGEIDRNAQTVT